jgi:tRNA G10  N-methylase Trm11
MVSVWDFGGTMPQKERKHYNPDEFPARMRPPLARALVEIYGKEPLLDPMCGSGTTCMEAALLGIESYGIELEQKNLDICKSQVPQIRGAQTFERLFQKDKKEPKLPVFQQGDATKLPFGEEFFQSIVFSPPYWNAIGKSQRVRDEIGSPYIQRRGSPSSFRSRNNPYGQTEGNIGNTSNYQTYLKQMGQVLSECLRVLKPSSFCVVVVKDLQRDYRLIPLHSDLIQVGKEIGFELYDLIINQMYHQIFWMVHHAMNEQFDMQMPRSFRIHEYVIIFIKPEE